MISINYNINFHINYNIYYSINYHIDYNIYYNVYHIIYNNVDKLLQTDGETFNLNPKSYFLIIFLFIDYIRDSMRRNAIEAIMSYATTEPDPISFHIPESIDAAQSLSDNSSSQGA